MTPRLYPKAAPNSGAAFAVKFFVYTILFLCYDNKSADFICAALWRDGGRMKQFISAERRLTSPT